MGASKFITMNKTHSAEFAGRSARKQQDVFQSITDAIIARIEAGTAPWQMPWSIKHDFPRNFVTGRRYSGVNLWLLLGQFDNPYYLTFKQVKDLGGSVIKGQRSTSVVYYRYCFYDTHTGEELTYDQYKALPDDRRSVYSIFRTYNVFNIRQTTLEFTLDVDASTDEPNAEFDTVYQRMPNRPMLHHGNTQAYYIPSLDEVHMPDKAWFNSQEHYYSTLFHELVHSTGHSSRLSRDGIVNHTNFGSEQYSREELVAEMGAAFLMAHCGSQATIDQSAAYLEGWSKALRHDPKLFPDAAAKAGHAVRFILGDDLDITNNEKDEGE